MSTEFSQYKSMQSVNLCYKYTECVFVQSGVSSFFHKASVRVFVYVVTPEADWANTPGTMHLFEFCGGIPPTCRLVLSNAADGLPELGGYGNPGWTGHGLPYCSSVKVDSAVGSQLLGF